MKNSTSTVNTNCCSIFSRAIASDRAQEIAAIFKVLGEPARLQLLSFIASQPDREACGCDLIEPLGLSQPTVSHHLKVLYQAGLLDKERRGNWIYYLINKEKFAMLQKDFLVSCLAYAVISLKTYLKSFICSPSCCFLTSSN